MLKELKKNTSKELKEIWKTIYKQNENINKDRNYKMKQKEISELKM